MKALLRFLCLLALAGCSDPPHVPGAAVEKWCTRIHAAAVCCTEKRYTHYGIVLEGCSPTWFGTRIEAATNVYRLQE